MHRRFGMVRRQVLAHLASKTASDGRAIESLVAGEGLQAGGREPSAAPAETLDSILARLRAARDIVVAALSKVPSVGDDEATTLDQWSRHYARHGIDLSEALPELRMEPMVLNWLLYADFRDEPVAFRRQQALLAEVRERSPSSTEHDEGDENAS